MKPFLYPTVTAVEDCSHYCSHCAALDTINNNYITNLILTAHNVCKYLYAKAYSCIVPDSISALNDSLKLKPNFRLRWDLIFGKFHFADGLNTKKKKFRRLDVITQKSCVYVNLNQPKHNSQRRSLGFIGIIFCSVFSADFHTGWMKFFFFVFWLNG